MARKIFVNLAVKDLKKTIEFFTHLGFDFNAQFTDEKAACMIISDDSYIMLLTEDFFKGFTKKEIVDAKKATEVLVCISAESREAVDALVNKAVAAGANTPIDKQDHGFMYGWGFEDLDGHQWEVMWMDPTAVEPQ